MYVISIAWHVKQQHDRFLFWANPGTVPHSLRGMALGQLQHLHALFVKSGWLDAQCELFNRVNAQAIENGEKFKQSSNLYAMDSYVVGPMTRPGLCAARQHDAQHSIAEAHQTSSFSELVNPYGLIVHVFVSHYWGHDFTSTVTALRLWAEQRMTSEKAALAESIEAMVFWICLFALNQHQKAEEVGENPRQGPFNAALAQARDGAVMVLDDDIRPFTPGGGRSHGLAWLRGKPVKALGRGLQLALAVPVSDWSGPGQFCGSWHLMAWGAAADYHSTQVL
eukprot:Skav229845  [mRNA]  locus=scaffold2033:311092:312156:- [translate_table: standard]